MKIKYIFVMIAVLVSSCGEDITSSNWSWKNELNPVHTIPGIPVDSDTSDDYIIHRYGYSLSYNKNLKVANWVCWNMNSEWYGDADRYDKFMPDPALRPEFIEIYPEDYNNSGFDRGHIVRSADRTSTFEINKSTFYMTNIYPMYPNFNQGIWAKFEDYCGKLCYDKSIELFVIAGGIFTGKNKIRGLVTIPDSVYKIVLISKKGLGIDGISDSTKVISVVFPNVNSGLGSDWNKYLTTVDRIENSTGYDFFTSINDTIQKIIESKIWK